jgi:hypothetical protein
MSWQNRWLVWALRRWVKPNSLRAQDIAASRALTERVPFGAKLAPGWHIRAAGNGEWIEPIASGDRRPIPLPRPLPSRTELQTLAGCA